MSEFTHRRLVSVTITQLNIGGNHVSCAYSSSYNRCKGYVEDFIENAAFAKSVTHPEKFDEDGNMLHDELIYIRPENNIWTEFDDDDDE